MSDESDDKLDIETAVMRLCQKIELLEKLLALDTKRTAERMCRMVARRRCQCTDAMVCMGCECLEIIEVLQLDKPMKPEDNLQ